MKIESKIARLCRSCENVRQDKECRLYCIVKSDTRKEVFHYVCLNSVCPSQRIDKKIIED